MQTEGLDRMTSVALGHDRRYARNELRTVEVQKVLRKVLSTRHRSSASVAELSWPRSGNGAQAQCPIIPLSRSSHRYCFTDEAIHLFFLLPNQLVSYAILKKFESFRATLNPLRNNMWIMNKGHFNYQRWLANKLSYWFTIFFINSKNLYFALFFTICYIT